MKLTFFHAWFLYFPRIKINWTLIKIYISGVYWSSTLYNTQNCSLLKKKKWRWIRKSRSLCKSNIYMLSPFPVRFPHWLWTLKPQDSISSQLGPERPDEETEKCQKIPSLNGSSWAEVAICTIILARLSMWYFETLSSQKPCVIVDDQRHIES